MKTRALLILTAAVAMIGCVGCTAWDSTYDPGPYYYPSPLVPPSGYLGWHVNPSLIGKPLPPPAPIPNRPVMKPTKPVTPPAQTAPARPTPGTGASGGNRPQTTPGSSRPGNNGLPSTRPTPIQPR